MGIVHTTYSPIHPTDRAWLVAKITSKSHERGHIIPTEAAVEMVASGNLVERERVALAMVHLNPGRTGEELDWMANATKREISKRLAGLSAKQKIRRGSREEMRACQVTGRLCLLWWPRQLGGLSHG